MPSPTRPCYDCYNPMSQERAARAEAFARQILETCKPFLSKPIAELDVLDVGCGYGHIATRKAEDKLA